MSGPTIEDLEPEILALMSDGRERTAEDVWRRMPSTPEHVQAALSVMVRRKQIKGGTINLWEGNGSHIPAGADILAGADMTATFKDWTPAIVRLVRKLNAEGKSRAQMSVAIYKRFGLDFTPSQVRSKCRSLGLIGQPAPGKTGGGPTAKKWHGPVLARLWEMAGLGHGNQAISEALNAEFGPWFSASGVASKLCRLRQEERRKRKVEASAPMKRGAARPGTRAYEVPIRHVQIGAVTEANRSVVTLPVEPWEVRT